jgi:uncharacterized membrane protein
MNIGGSIFLIAVGAILTFALNVSVSGVDLDVVGVILMLAGAALLLLEFAIWAPRRRATGNRVVEDRRVYDDRMYDDRPPL